MDVLHGKIHSRQLCKEKDCKVHRKQTMIIGRCSRRNWNAHATDVKEEQKRMKYYVAYGSNLNREQMAHRCPEAKTGWNRYVVKL